MALHPKNFNGPERLQPGARGEIFQADMPGYREQGDRINRTNNKLSTNAHDVPNIKYEFDRRLPVLFRYGFAYGYNQIVIPKGRIVAADPYMDLIDFDSQKAHSTLTLANGGVPVRLRSQADTYRAEAGTGVASLVTPELQGETVYNTDKDWVPLVGMDFAYETNTYRPYHIEFSTTVEASPAPTVSKFTVADAGLLYVGAAIKIGDATGVINKVTRATSGTTAEIELEDALDEAPTANDTVTFTTEYFGPATQLAMFGLAVDQDTGRITFNGERTNVRPGNIPIGILSRNEYTRDDDAYNGITPGAVLTDAMVELPWFAYKDKAEQNPWGSAYGGLFPGALVKSDENGRFVISPLSFVDTVVTTMSIAEYEAERQQVVGQVYSVDQNLVPEGAARWATWALSDRLNFAEFNPPEYPYNGRRGEDAVSNSPFKTTGQYPGYPYDKAFMDHDLHLLASTARTASNRMDPKYEYDNLGIPGLTDGHNAVVRPISDVTVGYLRHAGGNNYEKFIFRTPDVNIEDLQIKIGSGDYTNCVVGAQPAAYAIVEYVDLLQGIVIISIPAADKAAADAALQAAPLAVTVKYNKRGMSGVPTFLDWDGVVGSVKILLTK